MSRQSRFSKVLRRLAVPLVAAAATLGLATAPADAAPAYTNGWTFQTEVRCDPIWHRVSIESVSGSTTGWTSASTAYVLWMRFNGGTWTWWPMKQIEPRTMFLDYPTVEYNTPGLYEFWVSYGVWTNTGYSWTGGPAVHWIKYDGFTQNGGDAYCTI